MLIEQIIEFDLRVPRLLVVHVILKLVIFMTKQKSPKKHHRLKWCLLPNILPKAKYHASFDLNQVTYKI